MKKIGFIGMGNMAQAMALGFIKSGEVSPADISAYAPNQEKLKANAQKIGFLPCADPVALVADCDTVVAACKPYQIEGVFGPLKEKLAGKNVISVAAGWYYDDFIDLLGEGSRVQCILPNTPVAVGKGVMIVEEKNSLDKAERETLFKLLAGGGSVVEMPTKLVNAASSVSGCGPAFLFMVMEAMADGAVKNGVPRAKAYELIGQTMAGSAALLLETGLHPGQLKDNVCSPGGITIKGVAALEEAGLRNALIKAIDAVV